MRETVVNRKNKIIYLGLVAVSVPLLLVIGISLTKLPVIFRENQRWKGFYTVLVDRETGLTKTVEKLEKEGVTDLIHEKNSRVRFFSFHSEETVGLSELSERLDPLDPRYDPYMKQLPRFFGASLGMKNYDILYVRSSKPPAAFAIDLMPVQRHLKTTFIYTDIALWRHFILLFLFITVVVLIILYAKQHRVYIVLISLPWLLALFQGGIPLFLTAVLILFSFSLFSVDLFLMLKFYLNYGYLDYSHGNIIQKGIICIAAFISAVIVLLSPQFSLLRLLPLFLCIVADIAFLLLYTFYLYFRRKKQEHTLFFSVSIRANRKTFTFDQPRFPVLLVVFLVTACAPIIFLFHTPGEGIITPAPSEDVTFRDITMYSLERLAHAEASDYPDLSDYVTHRAYQKSYFFGKKYQFPQKGQLVSLSSFEMQNKQITKTNRVVETLDDTWFDTILTDGNTSGIPRLLLSQERAVAVIGKAVYAKRVKEADIIRYGVVCFLVFSPLLFFNYHLTPESLYGIKSLLLRRKSQAA
jgi:hypothetical protein